MNKCKYWRNQTCGAEFQDGDTSCMSSATLKVGPMVTNVFHLSLELAELCGHAKLLAAGVFLFKWIPILLYPGLYCSKKKNVCLTAAITVWSVETCSDRLAVQLFRIHFSGWYCIFSAGVTILQLRTNSNEVVKINWISSPISQLYMAVSLRAAKSELQETLEFLSGVVLDRTWSELSLTVWVRKHWGCTGFSPQLCPPWDAS